MRELPIVFLRTITTACLTLAPIATLGAADTEEQQRRFFPWEARNTGEISGVIQTLSMGRLFSYDTRNDAQLHSGTTAVTVNYRSPEMQALSLGLQYVHAFSLYSTGDRDDFTGQDPAYILSNSNFSILNNAYIRYNLDKLGLKHTVLTGGRQTLDLSFATPYNIRQKDQAYEAIVLNFDNHTNVRVSIGVLDKFSSWSSRDNLRSGSSANEFIPVEDTEDVPYSTKGFQFIDMTYSGVNGTKVTVYDYYGDRLYNTFGVNIDRSLGAWDDFETDLRLKYIAQHGIGRFETFIGNKLRADALQAGVKFKKGNFTIEPGIFIVAGDNGENDIRSPFQPKFIIEEPMVETDFGFLGGSKSFYIESTHNWSNNALYLLYLYTNLDSSNTTDSGSELDLIYSRDLTTNLYIKLKAGLVHYERGAGDDFIFDYRLFLGWRFN